MRRGRSRCACCETNETQHALKLLCVTWNLFEHARGNAKDWKTEKRGKRKREHDDEDIERLLQSSHRTTRSVSFIAWWCRTKVCSSSKDSIQSEMCGGSRTNIELTQHLELADGNGHIAQQEPLGEYAVSRFGQRQKTSIWSRMVERWVESACG
jgi:hypothetical protein